MTAATPRAFPWGGIRAALAESSRARVMVAAALACAALGVSCSAEDARSGDDCGERSSCDGDADGSGDGADGGLDGSDDGRNDGSDGGPAAGTTCEKLRLPPAPAPLALGFLIDSSVSMAAPEGNSKWELARRALLSFSDKATLGSLELALQFFPARFSEVCSPLSYEDPVVPFGAAPLISSALKRALEYEGPGGPTSPLEPALRGHLAGLSVARSRARAAVQVVSVLLTDGLPNDCGSSWDDVLAAARSGAEEEGIPTFVVALGDEANLAPLEELAEAGGGRVIFVDVARRGSEALTEAFSGVRELVSACELTLPRLGIGRLVPESVRLRFDGGAAGVESWPLLDRPERCAGDNEGFFYDVEEPRQLRLCPRSCERVRDKGVGSLELDIACVEVPR